MNRSNDKETGKILPVRIYGDQSLRCKSSPVEKIDDEIRSFVKDLTATMYKKDGVGLAAPQVGVCLRIFVVDVEWFRTEKKNPVVFINPVFVSMEGVTVHEEGCLSLPEITAEVKRADRIVLEAYDLAGNKQRYEAEDFYARAVQHEFDHLDGVLFIDRLSKLKLLTLKKKLKELEQTVDEKGVNLDTYIYSKEGNRESKG